MLRVLSSIFIISGILFAPVRADADSTQQLVKKGNTAYSTGKYDEALDAYEEAAVDAPESPHIYFNKGTALYQKQDYAKAAEAFKQAAIKSKDITLETYSKFNLGVLSFREAERQRDSDLNKSLEVCGQSIRYFQEALERSPQFKEAAENIEIVRLTMKSILDEINKQKKQQAAVKQTAEQIQKIIKKQQALLDRDKALIDEERRKGPSKDLSEKARDLAQDQKDLQQATKDLTQQMTPSSQQIPEPVQKAKDHMETAAGQQQAAAEKLKQDQPEPAGAHQEKSIEALEKALASLSGETPPPPQRQKPGGDQPRQQENRPSEDHQPADGNTDQQERASMVQLPDDARRILDEEKENKKRRRVFSKGGYKKVDKNW
jgi:tetratricopeptide (TPR) repeat protein